VFTRKKKRRGTAYFYVVENVRINGRVQQRVLCYLGKHRSAKAAYRYWERESEKPGKKTHSLKMMKQLEPYLGDS
jgi:hypothetical protein